MSRNDLLAIGHTALDYIIKLENFPEANSSASIENMRTLDGGAAANVAVVGANLGLKTGLISAVGDEFKNSRYQKKMEKLNIDIEDMIIVENEKSPTAFVLTNANGDQISYFYWGAGKEFSKSIVPTKAIEKADIVHLATGDPDFNLRGGSTAKKLEKFVSFDPGQDLHMYDDERLKEMIENSNIVFGNHYEIERILNRLSLDINQLRDLGPEIVVKTCGKEGSTIYGKNKIQIDSIYRPAVDPTGAGDSYRCGFLKSYHEGKSLEDCAKFASSVSSFIVEKEGCQTNIPNEEEAIKRMKDFY
ncbi:MAG: carbohydrate kinase family protein [Methanobrevibacter sp.]|jgi:ribokinase|nr:carbohydrate kinase family protein [Methanobrevibacter sp.]